jgi:hypothetical protein
MKQADFEAMIREHFGLHAGPYQELPGDKYPVETKIPELVEFARKVYMLGAADGRADEIASRRPLVPDPPKGIANFLLECGHIAQMKLSYAQLGLCRYLWCEGCRAAKLITRAPDSEVRT